MENFQLTSRPTSSVGSTLGISMTAAMLLAACGGGDSTTPQTQLPPPPPANFVQPAWGSMAVLVAPGQASKVFSFPQGTCSAGEGEVALFNASLEVKSNGDVAFKAATSRSAAASEVFALAQTDTKYRETRIYAYESQINYIDYKLSDGYRFGGESSKYLSFNAGEGEYLNINNSTREDALYQIRCSDGPITLAALTPAVMPSEQRAADSFFAGATDVELDQYNDEFAPRIVDGKLVWYQGWPGNQMLEGVSPAQAIQLNNGQWFNGYRASISTALTNAPAPIRVLFSGLLQSGEYREIYEVAGDERPENRYLRVYIDGESEQDLAITRLGSSLYIGTYFE
jgi:hypothetical protein